MNLFKQLAVIATLSAGLLLSTLAVSQQQQAASLDELLRLVKKDELVQSKDIAKRERAFQARKSSQAAELRKVERALVNEEARSKRLLNTITANERKSDERQEQLEKALGSLQELFGHLTGAAGDLREDIDGSIISAQYPGRSGFIEGMIAQITDPSDLPEIGDIRRVWEEMMAQMVESGKVVKFNGDVVSPGGSTDSKEIVRIGNYNLIADGKYLSYDLNTLRIKELVKQPGGLGQLSALQSATNGVTQVGIDPTGPRGGTFLSAIVLTPSQVDQWHQGGYVGYVISALGVFAVLLAIWRLIMLSIVSGRVRSQLKSDVANDNNPLGRIIKVYETDPSVDVETLELRLNEAIIKERPAIEAWINAIKIIAAISPLLGLLGTVTGMILTFQGIMIYGAGDVAGMADGISQALQTTKLGLFAAVPAVLMHTLVNSRATRIIHILDEQAAGIIAEKASVK